VLNGVAGRKIFVLDGGKSESDAENETETPLETGVAVEFPKIMVFTTCDSKPKRSADCACAKRPTCNESSKSVRMVVIERFIDDFKRDYKNTKKK